MPLGSHCLMASHGNLGKERHIKDFKGHMKDCIALQINPSKNTDTRLIIIRPVIAHLALLKPLLDFPAILSSSSHTRSVMKLLVAAKSNR